MISEKRKDWYYVKGLHKSVWKDEILQLEKESADADTGLKLARALATLQKQTGDNIEGDRDLVDIGVAEAPDSQHKAQVCTLKAFNTNMKAGS